MNKNSIRKVTSSNEEVFKKADEMLKNGSDIFRVQEYIRSNGIDASIKMGDGQNLILEM